MPIIVPGAAPVVVSIIADQRSINISWMMLECQDRHGNIAKFEVRYTSSDFGDNFSQTLNTSSGNETSLELGGLEEFTNYTIEVRAYTAVGPGPYSSPMDVLTLPDRKYIVVYEECIVCVCLCVCVCTVCVYVCVTVYVSLCMCVCHCVTI